MTDFTHLQAMLPAIEAAEMKFDTRTRDAYDDATTIAATADFNKVLEQAALAIHSDLENRTLADQYVKDWRPKSEMDTWFGPEPVKFILHILRDGAVHRQGLPDESVNR
ncbi:MAG: hypothetical protein EPO08_05745 [Rhodospirillaceae bacterium]|nr:MAG: hypothetical protein EPO08_05745 [Rhodospirillaceae bacterium]